MKERDKALEKYKSTKDLQDWSHFKNLRNSVTSKIIKERNNWDKTKLDSSLNSNFDMWKTLESKLGWGTNGPSSKIIHKGTIITSPLRVAQTINEFFIIKVKNLQSSIAPENIDPCYKLREIMKDRKCSFSFHAGTPSEVEKVVKGLKSIRSSGVDHIITYILNHFKEPASILKNSIFSRHT